MCLAAGAKTGLANDDLILVATDHMAKGIRISGASITDTKPSAMLELARLDFEQSRRGFKNTAFGIFRRLERGEARCERCGAARSAVREWSGGGVSESGLNFFKTLFLKSRRRSGVRMVHAPWPISAMLIRSSALPSSLILTIADDWDWPVL